MKAPKQVKRINVRGGSRDPNRGKWCTPLRIADALGGFELDPFSNPHAHIVAQHKCMLERGENGIADAKEPGSYLVRDEHMGLVKLRATEGTRTFIQPPYSIVQRALDHYGHTRFVALLRFDPRTDWFRRLYRRSALVSVLWDCEFEPPPGVDGGGGNSFPHALFFANASDVTDAVLRMTITWRTNRKD